MGCITIVGDDNDVITEKNNKQHGQLGNLATNTAKGISKMQIAFPVSFFLKLGSLNENDVKYEINWNGLFHY